jgi:ribosomal protein L40E
MDSQRLIGDLSKWVAPVVVLIAGIVGRTVGLGPALLILAAGVLTGVVLLFWSSIGRLTGESPLSLEEAVGLGAPSPEEERKRSILRALKDLEYERSVGKISDDDFAELSTRYRAEAKNLLKLIDAETAPLRKRAEERLAARLKEEKIAPRNRKKKAGAGSKKESVATETPEASDTADTAAEANEPVEASDAPQNATAGSVCPSCSTRNDPDAVFCKKCGVSLSKPEGAPT